MQGFQFTVFTWVYISWAAITVLLVVLVSYRAMLVSRDDQIFIDAGEHHHFETHQELLARRSRLLGEIIVLSVLSVSLLLACAGFSLYQSFSNI